MCEVLIIEKLRWLIDGMQFNNPDSWS